MQAAPLPEHWFEARDSEVSPLREQLPRMGATAAAPWLSSWSDAGARRAVAVWQGQVVYMHNLTKHAVRQRPTETTIQFNLIQLL